MGPFQGALVGCRVHATAAARHRGASAAGVRFPAEPPIGLGARTPARKRAFAEAVAQGEADYPKAIAAHAHAEQQRKEELAQAETAHDQSVSRERERAWEQHAAVDQMARDFGDGKRKAVADYFTGVLTVQQYPSGFPTGVKLAYLPAERELRIDIDLPLITAIPELESAEYLVTRKELKYKKLTAAALRVSRTRPRVLSWGLRGPLVLVDEPAQDEPALGPLVGEVRDRVIGPRRAELTAAMGSSPVVMGLVPGEDCAQMPFAEDQHPVGDLGPGGEHEPFRIAVRSRAPRQDFHCRDTSPGQDRVERCCELTGAVPDQEPEVGGAIVEVHQQVADLLGGP